jgi:hypothetical protein
MPYQFSDALDDELLYERCESFGGGMDAFSTPSLLPPDAWQYGQNVVVPDNLRVRTRPGADTLTAAPAAGHAIQGLRYFDTPTYEQLIAGANTKLWQWSGVAWAEMVGWTLNDAALQFASAQGVDKVLFSDGVQNMRSWNGAAFTDLGNIANSINSGPPVGATILWWHAGRMFASGKASADDMVWSSKLLDFGATGWDHTNFSFRVGGGEGDAVMMGISLPPAGVGDYRMAVLKANSVYTVNTDPTAASAAEWQIQKLTDGIGCVGRWAAALSGNDVLFMARDGVRSLRRMQSAAGQYELSPPLSTPLQPYIDRINWSYAHLIAAVNYKHLTLFAVPLDANTSNNTVLVWNGRLGRWTGIWTGWTPASWAVSRFGNVLRLCLGETTGLVRRWKDTVDPTDDATYLEDGAAIPSKLWTRAMLFGEPVNDKDGYHAETRFIQGNATVTLTALGDGAELRTWQGDLLTTGVDLPVDLPFDLPSPTAQRPVRRGLRGLTPFNEVFLKIESASGWWELKNVTLSAFLNMLQNQ